MDVEYDEGLEYVSHPTTYPPSAGSLSTEPTVYDPFTPSSGPATPQLVNGSTDVDSLAGPNSYDYDVQTGYSSLDGYFHPQIDYGDLQGTSNPRTALTLNNAECSYPDLLSTSFSTLELQAHLVSESTQGAQAFQMANEPFLLQNSGYELDHITNTVSSIWADPQQNQITFLGRQDHALLPSDPRSTLGRSSVPENSGNLPNSEAGALWVDESHQTIAALVKIEQSHHRGSSRHKERQDTHLFESVSRIPQGTHRCTWAGCEKRKPFKRMEHLKRHIYSLHLDLKRDRCLYCSKSFNRKDNYLQHLKLHTEDRKTSRTRFDPRAKAVYNAEMKERKRRQRAAAKNSELTLDTRFKQG